MKTTLQREISDAMASHGFTEVESAAAVMPGVGPLLRRRGLSGNRAVVVAELAEPPSSLHSYLRELRRRVAFHCGFFPIIWAIYMQVVLIAPGIADAGFNSADHVARMDNQWANIQSVFLVDPSAGLFYWARTWGQFLSGGQQDDISAVLSRHLERIDQ
ncbi:MAG: hypothetical protein R6U70_05105 [Bacillota bacterium]